MVLEQKRVLTYEDYAALPDDGKRYELIDGVLYVTAAPTPWHQRLADRICSEILFYLKTHPAGEVYSSPVDVILNPGVSTRVWQPDVIFISSERRGIITETNVQGAPDLVVEVLSESNLENLQRDVGIKKQAYMEAGVKEYWMVWQTLPRVEVYRLQTSGRYGDPHLLEEGDVLTTYLLPGFSLEVSWLYAGRPGEEGR